MNKKVEFPETAYPISSQVLKALEQFEQQQLSWLSGYCAGLAKGREGSSDSAQLNPLKGNSQSTLMVSTENAKAKVKAVQILYASQTGNAKSIAEKLHNELKSRYSENRELEINLANVSHFKVKNLARKQVILFIASTHGEGEPPDDAIEFIEFLKSKRAPKLDNANHAVLALGDSSYEYFCQTGKDLEQLLTKLGSTALLPRVDCDLDFEAEVSQWITNLTNEVKLLSANESFSQEGAIGTQIQSDNPDVMLEQQVSKSNPFAATILTNQKITASDADKTVHHIELSIEDSDIRYQPGDGVGIWAKNDPKTVNEILKLTSLSKDSRVSFKEQSYRLYDLLIERLEISLISKDFIKNYKQLVEPQNAAKAELLNDILMHSFAQFIEHNQVVDIIALAPIHLEPQQLVELLKPIKPRVYSIASSQLANPDEIHITVKLLETSNNKTVRKGTASRFLIEELAEEQTVMIYVERNDRFRLPSQETDILMVGPGTGVAPFRAFLQEREEQQASGKNWLFFGNSHFNSEFLYQLELQQYLNSGLLSELSVAFSRDQVEKIYVQDKLLENADSIWYWIDKNKASFYVCGDMNYMAKDVERTLIEIIQSRGNLDSEQAKNYLKELRKSGRYQRDVY